MIFLAYPFFKRNEWYYFVPRTKRGGKTPKRTVQGRGGSGTWKSTTGKEPVKDKDKKVEGYRQNLTYYKDVKGKVVTTGWVMTEYCLHDDVHDELVLCHIRRENKKKVEDGFVEEMPQVQKEEEEEAYAERIETMMLQGDNGQQREIHYLPPVESDDEDIMMKRLNQGQEQHQLYNFGFDGAEDLMLDVDELLNREDVVTQTNGIHDVEADATQAQDDDV